MSCDIKEIGASLSELFPFEYVGGGYFRRKGVDIGVSAEILHGMQAIEYLHEKMNIKAKVLNNEKND